MQSPASNPASSFCKNPTTHTVQFLELLALVEMQRHIGGANAVQCHLAHGGTIRLRERGWPDGSV